ncbi:uncharacterized protein PHALS_03742 [Plasmopara halstedii]|uniref:Uncharacterized protein n=1 Tax=Plasmopara halstedii TaxID=4781 RepID=A0A0P1AZ57_PLAHL|nr:uncharacterized protein PHALS_03742 [Plasmopara halstedii]CEG47086.1 hypothetical protein PHALS_03742 [Plasmopara halstedii]|eukprot:XP_024583455.1 hypothetical protein PHALS_03742 [Plasmopara halstedii]
MPIEWFRSHRRCVHIDTEDEDTWSPTAFSVTQQKPHQTTQRNHDIHSKSHSLRSIIGLGGSAQLESDAEKRRRKLYQTKTHRRFTIHGLSYEHADKAKSSMNARPTGSLLPMDVSASPRHENLLRNHFHLNSTRVRSPPTQQMLPNSRESHPSIIFIDCPP